MSTGFGLGVSDKDKNSFPDPKTHCIIALFFFPAMMIPSKISKKQTGRNEPYQFSFWDLPVILDPNTIPYPADPIHNI
jgi:hypothetical protein